MKKIYVDTNFLVSFLVGNHPFHKPAIRLFTELRINKYQLFISPLVLDETWWTIYGEQKKLNLIKIGIKDAIEELKTSWNQIATNTAITVIQLKNPLKKGVGRALFFIENLNMRPRDAFHLATAESNNICELATNDQGLIKMDSKISGFTVKAF